MGWGNCGEDSKGRPIGYVWAATCDHPECIKQIDRGLAYACGGMHGNEALGGYPDNYEFGEFVCEQYFCGDHLTTVIFEHEDGGEIWTPFMCISCAKKFEEEYRANRYEEMWVTKAPLEEPYR